MVYAPASPRSERCNPSSPRRAASGCSAARPRPLLLLVVAALALALVASCAQSEPAAKQSVLVLPVSSHWVSAPLAEALARSLPDALTKAGLAVTVMIPGSPEYQLGISEGWLSADDLVGDKVQAARHGLAARAGCDASLIAAVTERDTETALRGDLAGAVSHKQVIVSVTAPAGTKNAGNVSRDELAQTLSRDLAAKLTSQIWAEAGADEAGRRAAAPERFAAGQAALAAGRAQEAATEFAAALAGQPDSPDYLSAAADAAIARGRAAEAVPLLKRVSELNAGDRDVLLRMGDAALLAGQPDQAQAAFLQAAAAEPPDARALEGVARAARAQHNFARSEEYYRKLLIILRVLTGMKVVEVRVGSAIAMGAAPNADAQLPGILAHMPDDSIRLAASPEDVKLAVARAYFQAGISSRGVDHLLAYQTPDRPAYTDEDYLSLTADLDKAGDAVARRVGTIGDMPVRELAGDALNAELEALHDQSDALATAAERMKVSAKLDPAHRYRVLAYNLLNQSDFEALMYFQTHDPDQKRRSDLLRDAFRKAKSLAQDLASDLAGTRGSGPAAGG